MEKEPLSIMTVKTLLAVIIFTGLGTIIIGGAWLIGKQRKGIPVYNTLIEKCAKAGEESSNPSLGPKNNPRKCCEGLVEISAGLQYYPNNEYVNADENGCIRTVGSGYICSDCGNGICESWENRCNCPEDCIEQEVTITTNKTEYERGETVEIMAKNNLNNPIKHLQGIGCGLRGFFNEEWINVSSKSCKWGGEDKLKPDSEYNFNWTVSRLGLEKYRIAFYYQEQKLIDAKEIGKIICESKKFPDELEELLLNGKWVKGDNKGCAMCDACFVCSCTIKNAWAINGTVIDVHLVSCSGNGYTIKYKGEEYNCISENYKSLYEQVSLYPKVPEGWETIYSNEFTIKEKSALDPRCSEKVKGEGNCEAARLGYEFDQNKGRCVKKSVSGCLFKIPFWSLEECQSVCEKSDMSCEQSTDCIEKCPKCVNNPQLRTNCTPRFKCVSGTCECECVCLSMQ